MKSKDLKFGIIGSGSWGTALIKIISENIKSEDKKLLVTNHQAFKDNLLWRIMLNAKEVSKRLEKIHE